MRKYQVTAVYDDGREESFYVLARSVEHAEDVGSRHVGTEATVHCDGMLSKDSRHATVN